MAFTTIDWAAASAGDGAVTSATGGWESSFAQLDKASATAATNSDLVISFMLGFLSSFTTVDVHRGRKRPFLGGQSPYGLVMRMLSRPLYRNTMLGRQWCPAEWRSSTGSKYPFL